MVITEIVLMSADPAVDIHTPGNPASDALGKIYPALKDFKGFLHLAAGRHSSPDKSTVQTTAQWESMQAHADFGSSPVFPPFYKMITEALSVPSRLFHIELDRSVFEAGGPATSGVTEFVELYFPLSKVTAEFQKTFDEQWSGFADIYKDGSKPFESVASGWVLEETDYAKLSGEKAKSFVIVKGWKSMEQCEKAQSSDKYEKALQLMLNLHGSYERWYVELKIEG